MLNEASNHPRTSTRPRPASAAGQIRQQIEDRNPYEGQTVYIERPSALHAEDRWLSPDALRHEQELWDEAENTRQTKADATVHTLMSTNETREEPATKALENRLRIRFLSVKGNTMQGWIEARHEIIARELDSGQQ